MGDIARKEAVLGWSGSLDSGVLLRLIWRYRMSMRSARPNSLIVNLATMGGTTICGAEVIHLVGNFGAG
jgi:hypothetical protein